MAEKKQTAAAIAAAHPWSCEVTQQLNVPVEDVWAILGDFGGISKCMTNGVSQESKIVEGENNKPNCLRYCAVTEPDDTIMFAKERLLTHDDETHSMTYKVEDNNMGFESLLGDLRLHDGIHHQQQPGTTFLHWRTSFETIEGVPGDVVAPLLSGIFKSIVKTAEKIALENVAAATAAAVTVS